METTEKINRILVCEDNEVIIKVIEYKLRHDGYIVEIAKDGNSAIEKLNQTNYDLILTDLLMPFIGGLELINKIRNELKSNVPIIVLSALVQENTIIEALKLGADDYITKPFSPNELSLRVKRLLIRK
ncbi:MAG TPA: response regulator [Prolixibacteraceae bacterium]